MKDHQENEAAKQAEDVSIVATNIAKAMLDLHVKAGVPWPVNMAGGHAEVLFSIAAAYGGDVAADR